MVMEIAQKISYIRETMYGRIFDVKSIPNPNNIAYSYLKIDLHQDLMFFFIFKK